MGVTLGLLAGIGALPIPGVGSLIAAGPIVAALGRIAGAHGADGHSSHQLGAWSKRREQLAPQRELTWTL